MDQPDLPAGTPRRIGWLIMGTESYGVQRITTGMWLEVRRRGIDVHVMSVRPGDIAESSVNHGLPTTVFESGSAPGRWMARLRSVRVVRLVQDNIRVARCLRRQIVRDDLDLIQLSDIELVIAARVATVRTGAKICYLTPNRPPVHRVATVVFPRVLSGRRLRVLANSDDIKERFRRVGVESTTLLLGIDPDEFTIPAETPSRDPAGPARLITIGRLCTSKAQDLWAAASIELLQRGHDLTLTVVGGSFHEPEFVAELESLVAKSGWSDRISLEGARSDVMPLLAQADVALCGTREVEAFGLAAAEALSCERPVVVLGGGGIREIVDDGETGWFVPTVELTSVISTLERCLADRARWSTMGQHGRDKVLRVFTIARVVDRYLSIVSSP